MCTNINKSISAEDQATGQASHTNHYLWKAQSVVNNARKSKHVVLRLEIVGKRIGTMEKIAFPRLGLLK